MHRLLPFAVVLGLAVTCALSQSALAGVPTILTQQGRLLDSGGGPLTGSYSITYSIFETPTGGAPLWTETHPTVSVDDGLFTVQLGSITPLDANLLTSGGGGGGGGGGGTIERYLETSVGGSVITPRTRLVSSPYSVASSRVSGDIETLPGRIILGDLTGDGHADFIVSPDSVVNDYVQDNSPNNENRVKIRVTPIDAGVSMGRGGSTTATIRTGVTGGHLSLGGMSGSTTGTIRMAATPDSAASSMDSDSDGDGVPESSLKNKTSPSGSSSILHGMSGSTTGTIRMMATPDSTADYRDVDSDDDGIPESSDRRTVSANQVHHNVISRGGSTTATIRMATSPDSASSSLEWDSDNDGVPDCSAKEKGGSSGISHTLLGGHSGSTTGTIRMAATGGGGPILPSSSVDLEADLDGDGTMENTCRSIAAGAIAGIVVSSRFGSGPRQSTSMDGSFSHSHLRCDSDTDGDGVQDNSVISESSVSGASLRVISLNGLPPGVPVEDNIALAADGSSSSVALKKGVAQVGLNTVGAIGIPGGAVLSSRCLSSSGLDTASTEQSSDGSGAAMRAINTKGTGAVVRVAVTAVDDATVGVSNDLDGNGDAECGASTNASPNAAAHHLYKKGLNAVNVSTSLVDSVDGTGFVRRVEWDVNGDGSSDMVSSTAGDSTGTRSTWKGGMSGSTTGTIRMHASPESTTVVQECDDDDDGHAEARGIIAVKSPTGSGSASSSSRMTCDSDDDGVDDVTAEIVVDADSACFRLNGLPPGVPVTGTIEMTASPSGAHMSVGAATCDGTNWVNASDRNSKENFKEVNGEELLGKIADLEITRWNYKNDKATAHIGPTAQDFKEKFGVGSDGKSISTIDPSGIALAAIKELYKQFSDEMKQKDAQIEQLQNEMKKLRQELQKKN